MEALWVFLPLLGAFIAHAPVLRFDLLHGLKTPIDGGATLRGKRVFGGNKTWRGAVVMTTGVVVSVALLAHLPGYWSRLPQGIQQAGPLPFGLLLGGGAVLGELPNSFLKRQLGIAAGAQRTSLIGLALMVFDQGDFVLGAWIALAPLWVMPLEEGALAFVAVVAVHAVVNVLGYLLGIRKTWL